MLSDACPCLARSAATHEFIHHEQATATSRRKGGGTTRTSSPSGGPSTRTRPTWWASRASTRSAHGLFLHTYRRLPAMTVPGFFSLSHGIPSSIPSCHQIPGRPQGGGRAGEEGQHAAGPERAQDVQAVAQGAPRALRLQGIQDRRAHAQPHPPRAGPSVRPSVRLSCRACHAIASCHRTPAD